jgi:putative FmdB family regulatory protein
MESLQKMSDDPLKDCPACDRPALKKLVSAASFRLKGKGWYETDFKTGEKKQLAESDSVKAAAASDGGSSDGDTSKKSGGGDKAAAETGKSKSESKSPSQQDSKSASNKTDKSKQGSS